MLNARILKWFAILFSSGLHLVRTWLAGTCPSATQCGWMMCLGPWLSHFWSLCSVFKTSLAVQCPSTCGQEFRQRPCWKGCKRSLGEVGADVVSCPGAEGTMALLLPLAILELTGSDAHEMMTKTVPQKVCKTQSGCLGWPYKCLRTEEKWKAKRKGKIYPFECRVPQNRKER